MSTHLSLTGRLLCLTGDTAVPFSHVKTLSGTWAQQWSQGQSPEGLRLPHPRSFQVGTRGPTSHPTLATSRPTSEGHGSGHDRWKPRGRQSAAPHPTSTGHTNSLAQWNGLGGSHCTQPRLELTHPQRGAAGLEGREGFSVSALCGSLTR